MCFGLVLNPKLWSLTQAKAHFGMALKFQYVQFSGATSRDRLSAMCHDSNMPRVETRL
jgi:hypothetical protein